MRLAVAAVFLVACGDRSGDGPKPDPAGPITFQRDFSRAGTWRYECRQDMTMTTDGKPEPMTMSARGELSVTSNQDGTAALTLDAKLTLGEPGQPEVTRNAPGVRMELTETGQGSYTDSQLALLGLLLPVPSKPMNVGDVDTTTIAFPVKSNAGTSSIEAPMTLRFVGYSRIGARTCARMELGYIIDEVRADQKVYVRLTGNYCIDPEDAMVVTGKLAIDMAVGLTTPGAPSSMTFDGTMSLDRR